jgi:hypothetical protein
MQAIVGNAAFPTFLRNAVQDVLTALQNLGRQLADHFRLKREMLRVRIPDLATLADPGVFDLIRTAFTENMVETFFLLRNLSNVANSSLFRCQELPGSRTLSLVRRAAERAPSVFPGIDQPSGKNPGWARDADDISTSAIQAALWPDRPQLNDAYQEEYGREDWR